MKKEYWKTFGLNGYGCCEPLQQLIDDVMDIPNMRRISISPFADFKKSGRKFWEGVQSIHLNRILHIWSAALIKKLIKEYISNVLYSCKANGCKPEIILKDTHTVEKPYRKIRYVD